MGMGSALFSLSVLEFFNKSSKWYFHRKESIALTDSELTGKQCTAQKENNYKREAEAIKFRIFVH